jgi:2-polyprenyl-6-methoxyphenol hydroxylase-like FAD-dependent oxidoreductase
MNTINTDLIIIGAGPTGLSLACQCIRYGIDFVVVEKNATVTPYSKAIGVQAGNRARHHCQSRAVD